MLAIGCASSSVVACVEANPHTLRPRRDEE